MGRNIKKRPSQNEFGLGRRIVISLVRVIFGLRVALLATLLMVIILNHLGVVEWALDFLGRGAIAEANAAYIHETKVDLGESMLVLTALETGLEVLRSSSAGISFIVDVEVQVGNIVANIQTLVGSALIASIVAAGALVGTELITKLANLLAVPLLTATTLIIGAHYIVRGHWRWMANITGQLSNIMALITLIVHLGIPITIYGSSAVSKILTQPLLEESHSRFVVAHKDFATQKDQKIHDHVKSVINRYKATSDQRTHKKGRTIAGAVTRHIVGLLFNAFLFPGILLILLTWASRVLIRHTLNVERLIEEDNKAEAFLKKKTRRFTRSKSSTHPI